MNDFYQSFPNCFEHLSLKNVFWSNWFPFKWFVFICLAKFTIMNEQKTYVQVILTKIQSKWIKPIPSVIANTTKFVCMSFFFVKKINSGFFCMLCCPFNFAIWLVIIGLWFIFFLFWDGMIWNEQWRDTVSTVRSHEYIAFLRICRHLESHETQYIDDGILLSYIGGHTQTRAHAYKRIAYTTHRSVYDDDDDSVLMIPFTDYSVTNHALSIFLFFSENILFSS